MDIMNAIGISASGMHAQGDRLRIIAQNIANADTAATSPNEEPYRRKTILFKSVMDKELGADVVQAKTVTEDTKTPPMAPDGTPVPPLPGATPPPRRSSVPLVGRRPSGP